MGFPRRKINCHCSTPFSRIMNQGFGGRSRCLCSVLQLSKSLRLSTSLTTDGKDPHTWPAWKFNPMGWTTIWLIDLKLSLSMVRSHQKLQFCQMFCRTLYTRSPVVPDLQYWWPTKCYPKPSGPFKSKLECWWYFAALSYLKSCWLIVSPCSYQCPWLKCGQTFNAGKCIL